MRSSSASGLVSMNPNLRKCRCGQWAVVRTTLEAPNLGKRFLECPFYDKQAGEKGFGYFKWYKDEDGEGSQDSALDVSDLAIELELVTQSNKELSEMYDSLKEDNASLYSIVEKVNSENKLLKHKIAESFERKKKMKNWACVMVNNVKREKNHWKIVVLVMLIVFVVCKVF